MIEIPGHNRRRRNDRRAKAPKPPEPLLLAFSYDNLVELQQSVKEGLRHFRRR